MCFYLMITISWRLNNGCQVAKCIGCGNWRVLFDLLIRCASDASCICEKNSWLSSRHDSSLPLYVHKRYCLHCLTVCRQSIKIHGLKYLTSGLNSSLITSTTPLNSSTTKRLIYLALLEEALFMHQSRYLIFLHKRIAQSHPLFGLYIPKSKAIFTSKQHR